MLHYQEKSADFRKQNESLADDNSHIKKRKINWGLLHQWDHRKVRQLISISKKNIDLLIYKRGEYSKNTATFWSKERKQICTGTNLFFVPFLSDVYDVRQLFLADSKSK